MFIYNLHSTYLQNYDTLTFSILCPYIATVLQVYSDLTDQRSVDKYARAINIFEKVVRVREQQRRSLSHFVMAKSSSRFVIFAACTKIVIAMIETTTLYCVHYITEFNFKLFMSTRLFKKKNMQSYLTLSGDG